MIIMHPAWLVRTRTILALVSAVMPTRGRVMTLHPANRKPRTANRRSMIPKLASFASLLATPRAQRSNGTHHSSVRALASLRQFTPNSFLLNPLSRSLRRAVLPPWSRTSLNRQAGDRRTCCCPTRCLCRFKDVILPAKVQAETHCSIRAN